MPNGRIRFEDFVLDPADRQLVRGDERVDVGGRYFDALELLVREAGRLVLKDRLLEEVWRGVPVTDEALTQCIRTLRRQLGDDAARPRFIETVPKHGYRFIAPVEMVGQPSESRPASGWLGRPWQRLLLLGAAGTVGGGLAGFAGGLFYGLVGASHPLAPAVGTVSVLIVLLCLNIFVALIGAAGVSFGIAAADLAGGRHWTIAGGALGGMVVGAVGKLLGLDAFNLLLGRSPGDITGPFEGFLLGGAIGLGAWLGSRGRAGPSLRRGAGIAAVTGGAAGMLIPLLGGRLMGGSLDLLARNLPGSRLRLDDIGALFGEAEFGLASQVATGGLEGALFGACIAGAMIVARRALTDRDV